MGWKITTTLLLYSDWDKGVLSIKEFRARFRATRREMAATFCVNIICTALMFVPLWHTGISIFCYVFIFY